MPIVKLTPSEQLVSDMERSAEDLAEYIASGRCENWEDYRHSTGKLEVLVQWSKRLRDVMAEADEE